MFADVGANGGDERRHAAKGAPAQALARNLGEEALDEIRHPRGAAQGTARGRDDVMRPADVSG